MKLDLKGVLGGAEANQARDFSEDFWNFPRQISIKTTTIFDELRLRDDNNLSLTEYLA